MWRKQVWHCWIYADLPKGRIVHALKFIAQVLDVFRSHASRSLVIPPNFTVAILGVNARKPKRKIL